MKIIISQQNKKLLITFRQSNVVDKYQVDKADDFLAVVDRFLRKRKIEIESLQKVDLVFSGIGILAERIIRAIMKGLCF